MADGSLTLKKDELDKLSGLITELKFKDAAPIIQLLQAVQQRQQNEQAAAESEAEVIEPKAKPNGKGGKAAHA